MERPEKRRATMAYLPHELVADILSRLPPKSLMRFRSVCMLWHRLTCDSDFIKLHCSRDHSGEDDLNLLVCKQEDSLMEARTKSKIKIDGDGSGTIEEADDEADDGLVVGGYRIRYNNGLVACYESHIYCVERNSLFAKAVKFENPMGVTHFSRTNVLGSCNGIVCLVRRDCACLWNPYTSEYKFVRFDKELNFDYAICGFGYDAHNDDYKLVRFSDFNYCISSSYPVEVYSLNDASCSILNIPYQVSGTKTLGIFVSQALHWVGAHSDSSSNIIIAFDIGENVFRKIEKPVLVHRDDRITVGEMGGQLCMLSKKYHVDIQIWVMKNYGVRDSWSKLFAIENSVYGLWKYDFGVAKLILWPLCFGKNDEVLLMADKVPVLYNPTKKTARKLETNGISDWPSIRDRVMTYVPSLVGLKSGTYMGSVIEEEEEEEEEQAQ